ncbi:FkbM family methyltransferase [Scytonema sp. UIC 10036]|uniref:FkbM family methyltransferase n=1 Tax=Scytonema sp. UIC 10036 TaxID=2304196 RepID=UPI0012DA45C7|nr:FkbM family methyltransferase [Scytonema sp. UIC 10036]MUG96890.1 FkbM family methyltransferase [Scytonema sp. UIC 10036]
MLGDIAYSLISAGYKMPKSVKAKIERFFYQSYIAELLKKLRINCVLDVGANIGTYAQNLRKLGYKGHILCFEPHPEIFPTLQKNFKHDPLWRGYNLGLGNEDALAAFHFNTYSELSSFLVPEASMPKTVNSCEVKIKPLDSLLDEILTLVPEPRIFLKMDTQGYDTEVVKGASKCMDKVLCLQSEIAVRSYYMNMPSYLDALRYYETLGFELVDLFAASRNPEGCVVEYDCLMVRSEIN